MVSSACDIRIQLVEISPSLFTGASVPGLIFLGWLSDLLDVRWSILLSSLGSALSVFLLWGFAETLLPLLMFACVYGFLAPSWSALWPRFVATADGDDPHQASTLMSIFIGGMCTTFTVVHKFELIDKLIKEEVLGMFWQLL